MNALMSFALYSLVISLTFIPCLVMADDGNGMDMSMDGSMTLMSGTMLPYLHFTRGDTIWLLGWVPQSPGAVAGACIGLFLLSLVDRWLAAIRAMADSHWRRRAQIVMSNKPNFTSPSSKRISRSFAFRHIPPFILAHDIARGILHAGQMALAFAFMLVVMTYQAAFIISIVIGLGVGESVFGRYASAASAH